jgi:SAM-dependent methyltransferase
VNLKKLLLDYHHKTVRLPRRERITRSLAAHLGRVDSLLDIGCGDGKNTQRLGMTAGATRIVGVDVHVRQQTFIEVQPYNGRDLPFPDASFDAVSLLDVLHHCEEPERVLREAVRVARSMVVLKDHFAFGPLSYKLLHYMDLVGNAKDRIPSPATYFHPREWVGLIDHAGARVAAIDWPLSIHGMPWGLVARPELEFTAKLVPIR